MRRAADGVLFDRGLPGRLSTSLRNIAVITLVVQISGACGAAKVIEDWSRVPVGSVGIPVGWRGSGGPFDITVAENGNYRALRLRSSSSGSSISKEIRVELRKTPVLQWSWMVLVLPQGSDVSDETTADRAAELCLAWPQVPALVRSRFICYVWDAEAPQGTIVRRERVAYIVVRSGSKGLGTWFIEERDVFDDFKRIYGDDPADPGVLFVAIDSRRTKSVAESYVGVIGFRSHGP